jgi:hypothetical protein
MNCLEKTMTKKFEDPIVEEIHQTRAKLLEKHGGSDGYAEHLRQLEVELADRLVTREPRPGQDASQGFVGRSVLRRHRGRPERETGKIEDAWSGVPYMDTLIRSGRLILGFDLGKELVAIPIP